MDKKAFYELVERMSKDEVETMDSKGGEYTGGSNDVLNHFKDSATGVGLTPLQIWATFANKHWRSIMSYIRNGDVGSDESIEGRIKDLRNYLTFLRALIEETKTSRQQYSAKEVKPTFQKEEAF